MRDDLQSRKPSKDFIHTVFPPSLFSQHHIRRATLEVLRSFFNWKTSGGSSPFLRRLFWGTVCHLHHPKISLYAISMDSKAHTYGSEEHRGSQVHDSEIGEATSVERVNVKPKGDFVPGESSSGSSQNEAAAHGAVELIDSNGQTPIQTTEDELERTRGHRRFGYLRSKQFWIVLILSQTLALTSTGTNTFTTLLVNNGTSIPAFQSLFNYILLNIIYTSYTLYKYGFKGWFRLVRTDGWRYFILAFCDVQGNYFTVLAYRYTTILSAQLINFWAIAVVVFISIVFLKVRYHFAQYAGILICCGGLGMLLASDHIHGLNGGEAPNALKGDLFALVGASMYGLTNVFEEFLVSKKPVYEVLGQLSFYAMFINGVQAGIFDRASFRSATWNSTVGGYLTGYTFLLTFFYSAAPFVFRMASAAFFNIGLLTGNFWGVIVGLKVFHDQVHWMYPVAFVLIMFGHFVYYGTEGVLGESSKPWLGENQEGGNDGFGTARRQLERPDVIV
ncbi:Hypothetical protein R9X50_00588100 [Acrodontium crateriforme]|uniref:DUF914-domain-containing protein n=1 Tax=Acrodontium crateriforme TaxID=150365 RepID=A0AAQ3M8M5_9PEZI|nr:Hypothetical protein R9X50_00588100 [Acrodontium crateriforme]